MSSASLRSSFPACCRKIVCIGRNYLDHVNELNNVVPAEPMMFLKPTTSILKEGEGPVIKPKMCTNLHHEIELGIVIGKTGSHIAEDKALEHIGGYVLALDMTCRDQQEIAKKKGIPWLLAKCFDTHCPISDFLPTSDVQQPDNVTIWVQVDEEPRQRASTSDMLFKLERLISYASQVMTLEEGDLILTGTPSGVGPVSPGQTMYCGLEDAEGNVIKKMQFSVADA